VINTHGLETAPSVHFNFSQPGIGSPESSGSAIHADITVMHISLGWSLAAPPHYPSGEWMALDNMGATQLEQRAAGVASLWPSRLVPLRQMVDVFSHRTHGRHAKRALCYPTWQAVHDLRVSAGHGCEPLGSRLRS
jgi:hypothetical protein